MSKVNLELSTPSDRGSVRSDNRVDGKGRQFYIKTSEGKRKRVTVSDYEHEMRSRVGKSESKTGIN